MVFIEAIPVFADVFTAAAIFLFCVTLFSFCLSHFKLSVQRKIGDGLVGPSCKRSAIEETSQCVDLVNHIDSIEILSLQGVGLVVV